MRSSRSPRISVNAKGYRAEAAKRMLSPKPQQDVKPDQDEDKQYTEDDEVDEGVEEA